MYIQHVMRIWSADRTLETESPHAWRLPREHVFESYRHHLISIAYDWFIPKQTVTHWIVWSLQWSGSIWSRLIPPAMNVTLAWMTSDKRILWNPIEFLTPSSRSAMNYKQAASVLHFAFDGSHSKLKQQVQCCKATGTSVYLQVTCYICVLKLKQF